MSFSKITAEYFPLTDVQKKSLDTIGERLVATNEVMNLTAITDEKGVALLHFYDCLTLLETGLFKDKKIIDVGCGGGFPSLPLAACSENCFVTANDSTAKKLAFVSDCARAAGLHNLETLCGRAEELSVNEKYREKFDIAVSRGVARMNILCEWCLPFVKVGGYFVAMKGEKGSEETAEAENAIKLLGGELVDIINKTVPEYDYLHTLVVIKKIKPTPASYPRKNGQIMKKPL